MDSSLILLKVNGETFPMTTKKLTQDQIDDIETFLWCFFDEDDPVVPIEEAMDMSTYSLLRIVVDEIEKHCGVKLFSTLIDAEFSIDINN